jgi:hypothetical protein
MTGAQWRRGPGEPVLTSPAEASVQGLRALGPDRGARLRRLGDGSEPVESPEPVMALQGKFHNFVRTRQSRTQWIFTK